MATSCEREIGNYCRDMGRWSGYLPIQQIGEKLPMDTVDCWLKITDTVGLGSPIFYQIDDQQSFNQLVECNCDITNFNFQDYTLLMGYYFTIFSSSRVIKQEVKLHCEHFEQWLNYWVYVKFDTSEINPYFVQYHAVIPKLPEGLSINHRIIWYTK